MYLKKSKYSDDYKAEKSESYYHESLLLKDIFHVLILPRNKKIGISSEDSKIANQLSINMLTCFCKFKSRHFL